MGNLVKGEMKALRKLMLCIASLILLLSFTNPVNAETRSIDELRNSVVRILCFGLDGGLYTGTGFAVGTGEPVRHIVTNYHVVEPNLDGVTVLLSKEDQITATVIAFDRVKDIAVLELSQDLFKRPPMELGDSDAVKASDEVYALGFPGDADLIDDTPSGEPDDVTITRGIISKISTQGGRGIFQVDVDINPGNSGGPLVNEEGQVIGINTFGVTSASGINGSVRIDELIPILESRGIEYLSGSSVVEGPDTNPTTNTDTDDDDGIALWIIIAIVAGGIIFILFIVILLVVVLKKKGNKPTPNRHQHIQQVHTAHKPVQTPPVVPSSPNPLVTKPVLIGLSGYFAGQIFELDHTYLSIGRDSKQCQLVYPLNHEQISRKHCTLRFDRTSQSFTIEDSSSNGTFLQSGERIPSGKIIQLRSGDHFYLSSRENLFEVRLESR